MKSHGHLPEAIPSLNILENMGENIIVADINYNIVWVNKKASSLLAKIVPLFGLDDISDMIGLNMSHFHKNPERQERIMEHLTGTHKARITIKDQFVADIIVNTIYNNDQITGYVALLQDVTTKAEEENRKEQMIDALSVPILKIWHKTIAIPLFGGFDMDRGELLVTRVLETCTKNRIQFVLVDLSGLTEYREETASYIKKLCDTLRLIGAECIIVGISADLAVNFAGSSFNSPTFSTSQQGLQYILKIEEDGNNI
ncbi:RsbR, positive regulator of sigma-B [Neobacillus sp. PS3-34]|uniref:STAS domain-containing protein n=1 Tax=Neobacillus sp. PS3-34 TaxID=3070678 RepID=UPI0027E1D3B6|nr:STAS domain-containing protein [Neobacillus sp. PS3-34]WML47965.1 RsbR, positive regulator of sigma-B [Neobacillus sp. PS3-34]